MISAWKPPPAVGYRFFLWLSFLLPPAIQFVFLASRPLPVYAMATPPDHTPTTQQSTPGTFPLVFCQSVTRMLGPVPHFYTPRLAAAPGRTFPSGNRNIIHRGLHLYSCLNISFPVDPPRPARTFHAPCYAVHNPA